ncbi:MAG: hypothetical protein NVSMB62_28620 [Acidobacteriaceae bacterium]
MSPNPTAKPAPPKQYFGKYRGTVLHNLDPMQLGRIQAQINALPGIVTNWALPCVPYSAPGTARTFSIPPVGENVWIEFEQGDPNNPIWTGCFWSQGQPPLINT